VHGNVVIDNAANINATSGVGIGLYNFGVGNLSATIEAPSIVKAITAGVNAFAQGGGSVSIVNQGTITVANGAGITIGTGMGTPNSVNGVISVNNSGVINSLGSAQSPDVQINNASTQAAIFTNSGIVTAGLFGRTTYNLAVAEYNGSITINNTGTITGNVSLSSATFNNNVGGTWKVNGWNFLGSAASVTNAGFIAISGLSYLNAVGLFALNNASIISIQPNSAAFIDANVSGTNGVFIIGDRSELEFAGSVAGQTVSFAAGGRGVLTLDSPSTFQGTISGLSAGNIIDFFGGVIVSSASITATTLTITKPDSTTLTYQVTGVQPNTTLNVLSADKIVVVPTTAVTITGLSTPYGESNVLSSKTYIFANNAIVGTSNGIGISATDSNQADTIFVNVNQTSSVSVSGSANGIQITTGGAGIVLMNAGNISSSNGNGIFTSSLAGSTDMLNYGNVSGNTRGIFANTSGAGSLNIVVGSAATVTGTTSHGILAISTLGAVNITTLPGVTINSGAVGIFAQNQGTSVPQGVLGGSNSSISVSTSNGTINAGSTGISATYMTGTSSPATIPDPPNTAVYGDITIDNNATITAGTGVGISAVNYAVGNISVSTGSGGSITATGATQTQYGIFAFNYGSGNTTVTTAFGSSITSGGTGLNAGNQASSISAGAASTITVVALGSIHSGPNTNNSGSAPSGIQAGYNPKGAGVFNGNISGDLFVFAGGNITADAGDGINAYNYGVGDISVNVGFNVSIQALTPATSQSGTAPYGIGAFNYGPGDIHVTTSNGDAINSGSSGINAVNQATSIAAAQGALVTVSAAGTIHSGTINNNSGSLPSGITAGFLGGTSSTQNLNVNGTVIVNNAANVTAAAGIGLNAYNYGNGDITINDASGTTVSGVLYGIDAHAEAVGGTGNIAINVYANATINSTSSYGILAFSNDIGNISIITGSGDIINAGSAGINAVNQAAVIPASANSSIVITAAGTINSGVNPTGTGNQPAGILAGYLSGNGSPVVPTTFPLTDINGEVVVNNFATINAAGGDGIRAYNYGIGDVTVNDFAGTITALDVGSSTPGLGIGIAAFNYGSGDIHISTSSGTSINSASSGIAAVNKAPSSGSFVVPSTSEISVLAFGTINSGSIPTATVANDPAAGILAGYNPNNSDTPDNNVHGNVSIDDYASISAAAGTDGIRAVNYGTGTVTIISEAGAVITAGRYGIGAFGFDGGDVSIKNNATVTGGTAAIDAVSTSTGIVTIDNFGTLVGNVISGSATFHNELGAFWNLAGASTFASGVNVLINDGTINTTGTSSITTSGLLSISHTGLINVQSGSLNIGAAVSGTGIFTIGDGATLEFGGSVAAGETVSFLGMHGTLVLDHSLTAPFAGQISNLQGTALVHDNIDLLDLVWSGTGSASYVATAATSGVLTVNDGNGHSEVFNLVNYTGPGIFTAQDDGHGGTLVFDPPAPMAAVRIEAPPVVSPFVEESSLDSGYRSNIEHAANVTADHLIGHFLNSATDPVTNSKATDLREGQFASDQTSESPPSLVLTQSCMNALSIGQSGNTSTQDIARMWDGAGSDTFAFKPEMGAIIRNDFSDYLPDKIELEQSANLKFAEFHAIMQSAPAGNDTHGDSIATASVPPSPLHGDHFVFYHL
jgi:hypothetical protein